jgi:hypothetical protein
MARVSKTLETVQRVAQVGKSTVEVAMKNVTKTVLEAFAKELMDIAMKNVGWVQ